MSQTGDPSHHDPKAETERTWHKVAGLDELPEGRVKTVTCGVETLCLTHFSPTSSHKMSH